MLVLFETAAGYAVLKVSPLLPHPPQRGQRSSLFFCPFSSSMTPSWRKLTISTRISSPRKKQAKCKEGRRGLKGSTFILSFFSLQCEAQVFRKVFGHDGRSCCSHGGGGREGVQATQEAPQEVGVKGCSGAAVGGRREAGKCHQGED